MYDSWLHFLMMAFNVKFWKHQRSCDSSWEGSERRHQMWPQTRFHPQLEYLDINPPTDKSKSALLHYNGGVSGSPDQRFYIPQCSCRNAVLKVQPVLQVIKMFPRRFQFLVLLACLWNVNQMSPNRSDPLLLHRPVSVLLRCMILHLQVV